MHITSYQANYFKRKLLGTSFACLWASSSILIWLAIIQKETFGNVLWGRAKLVNCYSFWILVETGILQHNLSKQICAKWKKPNNKIKY